MNNPADSLSSSLIFSWCRKEKKIVDDYSSFGYDAAALRQVSGRIKLLYNYFD